MQILTGTQVFLALHKQHNHNFSADAGTPSSDDTAPAAQQSCAETSFALLSAVLFAGMVLGHTISHAQSPNKASNNEDVTLVIGTRFAAEQREKRSAKSLFFQSRIPIDAFNETDHCIDQGALDVAREYFTDLGRVLLEKVAYFYFIPDSEVAKLNAMCTRLHKDAPKAWTESTKIIAFGKVVPTPDALTLERSLR